MLWKYDDDDDDDYEYDDDFYYYDLAVSNISLDPNIITSMQVLTFLTESFTVDDNGGQLTLCTDNYLANTRYATISMTSTSLYTDSHLNEVLCCGTVQYIYALVTLGG